MLVVKILLHVGEGVDEDRGEFTAFQVSQGDFVCEGGGGRGGRKEGEGMLGGREE